MTLVTPFHNKPCCQPGGTRGASRLVYRYHPSWPAALLAPEMVGDTNDDRIGSREEDPLEGYSRLVV